VKSNYSGHIKLGAALPPDQYNIRTIERTPLKTTKYASMSSEIPKEYRQNLRELRAKAIHPLFEPNPHYPHVSQFGRYATLPEFSNRMEAIILLETQDAILKSYMTFAEIKVPLLEELRPNNIEKVHGDICTDDNGKPLRIRIQLRAESDPSKFKPLNDLLGSMYHELGHCSSMDHSDRFWVICR
jgi:hypothetical protein